jgi:hypothetical protein
MSTAFQSEPSTSSVPNELSSILFREISVKLAEEPYLLEQAERAVAMMSRTKMEN